MWLICKKSCSVWQALNHIYLKGWPDSSKLIIGYVNLHEELRKSRNWPKTLHSISERLFDLPFAFHALTHPCFCPLLSTSLLLTTTLLLQASELNFCLSLLLSSILLIYSGSSSLKLILNISIFPCDFCYWMKRIIGQAFHGKPSPTLGSQPTGLKADASFVWHRALCRRQVTMMLACIGLLFEDWGDLRCLPFALVGNSDNLIDRLNK